MQLKQARSPVSACFRRTQQSLAARPPHKGRTLARPSYSVLLPVNHQVLARSILLARVSTPRTCHGGKRIRLRAEPDTARQRVMTLRGGVGASCAALAHSRLSEALVPVRKICIPPPLPSTWQWRFE
jgi:hypothetical protein